MPDCRGPGEVQACRLTEPPSRASAAAMPAGRESGVCGRAQPGNVSRALPPPLYAAKNHKAGRRLPFFHRRAERLNGMRPRISTST